MRKVIWGCVVLLLNLMGPGCANDNAAVSAGRADNFKEPDPEQNIEGEKYTDFVFGRYFATVKLRKSKLELKSKWSEST